MKHSRSADHVETIVRRMSCYFDEAVCSKRLQAQVGAERKTEEGNNEHVVSQWTRIL